MSLLSVSALKCHGIYFAALRMFRIQELSIKVLSKHSTMKKITGKVAEKKIMEKDIAATYNEFKEFEGRLYTGMTIGRSHKWNYDKGVWKETKITPDKWKIEYAVNKRRAGKAPEGSGVPVGTEYHWYILTHQNVTKLDANTYTTSLTGVKYKLAHKRPDMGKWSISIATQRKHLVKVFEEMIEELKREPDSFVEEPLKNPIAQNEKKSVHTKKKALSSKSAPPSRKKHLIETE
jgi:hypothetical protein